MEISKSSNAAILEVDESSFVEDVIERSHEVPVVVDFWAAWCGPCRALGPILEKLAKEDGGSWVLAKVDVDANQQLAAAAGVQGIPAVRAFKDGKQVAEFTGALPEDRVRGWLAQLGPSRTDLMLLEASDLAAGGNIEGARALYAEVLEHDPGSQTARSALARLDLSARTSKVDQADLGRRANDPHDIEAITALADLDLVKGDKGGAFRRLLDAIAREQGDARDALRVRLLELLQTCDPADDEVLRARRELSRILY